MGHRTDSPATLEVVSRLPIEIIRTDGAEYLQGYAACWYDGTEATEYLPLPNVRERVARGAFDDVLQRQDPIECWYNHSPDHVLGSTDSQTLFLSRDDRGLKFLVPFDSGDPDHVKVAAKLRKGIATGASFQGVGVATLKRDGTNYLRTIEKIESLKEVSIVNHPAYRGTEALMRSIEKHERTREKIRRARLL